MVKFHGLICEYDEENEPIVNEHGGLPAVFTFDDVVMTTIVDPMAKFRDWLVSAKGFAQIWKNAFRRGERHLYEADMAGVGVLFKRLGEIPKGEAGSLSELNRKWSIADEL